MSSGGTEKIAYLLAADGSSVVATSISRPVAEKRRRQIGPEAGRALETLGHAIDYLVDEFVYNENNNTMSTNECGGRVEAIQLLMALNRHIYFECPIVLTLGKRICAVFKRKRDSGRQ